MHPDLALVCPITKLPLRRLTLEDAQARVSGGAALESRTAGARPAVGPTPTVLVRADDRCAYPVLGEVPVLLGPERLVAPGQPTPTVGSPDERYAEAYCEMDYYNAAARHETASPDHGELQEQLSGLLALPPPDQRRFPEPRQRWLDATYEPVAQWDAFCHVAPLTGTDVLQVGGRGVTAARFLAAGAAQAALVTPMYAEAEYGRRLAEGLGAEARWTSAVGVAEELPFADETFDVVYAGGTLHHTITALVAPEVRRVLRPGGRFAAVEPWRAPLYEVGTRLFGKREDVPCRPLTQLRAEPLLRALHGARVVHHGALTRYPMLALARLGWAARLATVWRITRIDDWLCSAVPAVRRRGSSSAVLGRR